MGWLKEWDKCVFKRANPPKKRRYNEEEEEEVYVSWNRGYVLLLVH
jgi:chromosome transmission fidelity protein 18